MRQAAFLSLSVTLLGTHIIYCNMVTTKYRYDAEDDNDDPIARGISSPDQVQPW